MLSPQAKSMPPTQRAATSNWRDIYFAAVVEADQERALVRIESAREVLQGCLLALQPVSSGSTDELRDLISALTYLDILFSCIAEDSPGAHMAAVA